jgi:acetylornithine/succinyldiaminopimelate/putrescine aminotransferase
MRTRHGDIFSGVRQKGLVMGLEFAGIQSAFSVSRALYEHGIWAIFSSPDKQALQFKPGMLLTADLCQGILARFDAAMPRAPACARGANAS